MRPYMDAQGFLRVKILSYGHFIFVTKFKSDHSPLTYQAHKMLSHLQILILIQLLKDLILRLKNIIIDLFSYFTMNLNIFHLFFSFKWFLYLPLSRDTFISLGFGVLNMDLFSENWALKRWYVVTVQKNKPKRLRSHKSGSDSR